MQSRYYNPEWGRFLNADIVIGITGDLIGHNMFVYCQNNPVIYQDPSGYSATATWASTGWTLCLFDVQTGIIGLFLSPF
ncbi:MAG: RHS repeat-associated core domain-containing protein [Bacillota bacterium]